MNKMVAWIKAHKWNTLLIILGVYLGFYVLRIFFGALFGVNVFNLPVPSSSKSYGSISSYESVGGNFGMVAPQVGVTSDIDSPVRPAYEGKTVSEAGTVSVSTTRMVVQNSNLSLVVKDVKKSGEEVINYANSVGGFMVSSGYSRPNESPFANITIRVPSDRLKETVSYLESLAINVTNENLTGTDITDHYTDIEARITALESTKKQFEDIMKDTSNIDQILRIQRELVNIQTQIDMYKGQQMAMEKEAKMAKITVYLSSDEFSLPYTPDNKFRPGVTFKLAVRSLMIAITSFAELFIWILVYAVIWLPALIGFILFKRRKNAAKETPTNN